VVGYDSLTLKSQLPNSLIDPLAYKNTHFFKNPKSNCWLTLSKSPILIADMFHDENGFFCGWGGVVM